MIGALRDASPWGMPFQQAQDMVGEGWNILELLDIIKNFLSFSPKYYKIFLLAKGTFKRGPLLFEEAQKGFE